jgi:hypothetical protein
MFPVTKSTSRPGTLANAKPFEIGFDQSMRRRDDGCLRI